MAIRCIFTTIVMAIAVTACGSTHHTTATDVTGAAARPEWDPCAGIDPATLRRAGLDPASMQADSAGAAYPGWKICSWQPPNSDMYGPTGYDVTVFSTNSETVDDLHHDPINNHLVDVTVAGRPALQYHLGGGDPGETCAIALATATNGVVLVTVDRNIVGRYFEPVCTTTQRAATVLLPMFPR